ncbi:MULTISPECIES: AraC family transcriptional regulator [Barnesiella]|uniref:helix-turn-helix domain-containing protein n=1 Tax=Barnesiella TaxID=397864 RepID=UPI000B372EA1|nr:MULTISPECIES: AraC family transcriptional regulator [Barnesiella]MDM8268379.1 AraC family transcriptional regulator [Barnesiella viscericola]OUO99048.1 AraC family transcriptional regulator [Barnesiella sp. An22]HJB73304.1 AraC family transcriptional regulator [Candidatus Barnesiella merdigallinarum]
MERLEVFDYSNVLIASYFTDNRGCAHENRDHTLIYLCSGELEIEERGRRTVLRAGDCAFMRRDNRMWLQKRIVGDKPYHSIALKFSKAFLREFYQQRLDPREIPAESRRERVSLWILPRDRADVRSLFESVIPYFESGEKPSEEILKLKMVEGVYVLLHTDSSLYASLFDFVEPWKIDILDYLNENYMFDLSLSEIAGYTGRSLATFKRDFAKVSDLTPQKWIIRRRLAAAHDLIKSGHHRITDVCYEVGFKNLAHFSRAYKEVYGVPPSAK